METLTYVYIFLAISAAVSLNDTDVFGSAVCDYIWDTVSVTVNCSSRCLKEVPFGLPSGTVALLLTGNKIQRVDANIFSYMKNLQRLYINSNILDNIDVGAFNGLSNLEVLDLSYNHLTEDSFPDGVFDPLPFLKQLNIGAQSFRKNNSDLPWKALSVLAGLQRLTIEGILNLSVPHIMSNLTNLEALELIPCKLRMMTNETFMGFSNSKITTLRMSSCTFFRMDTGSFLPLASTLQSIDIGAIFLAVTEPLQALCGLHKLKTLYLNNFSQEDISLDAADLHCLGTICIEDLQIIHSMIKRIDIFSLYGTKAAACLKNIDLSWNHFNEPEVITLFIQLQVFTSIESFNLSSVYFGLAKEQRYYRTAQFHIPSSLETLKLANLRHKHALWQLTLINATGLKYLDLSFHGFTACDQSFFIGAVNLEYFDLSGLMCETFNATYFSSLSTLKTLIMRDSIKPSFPQTLFNGLYNLQQLDISKSELGVNKIQEMLSDQHHTLTKLTIEDCDLRAFPLQLSDFNALVRLNLQRNRLKELDSETRSSVDRIRQVHGSFSLQLKGNNFVCLCEALDFIEWLFTTNATLDNQGNYPCLLENGTISSTRYVFNNIRRMRLACVSRTWLMISSISLIVLVILISILALLLRHKFTLEMYYYKWFKPDPKIPTDDTDYHFDGYVSYQSNSLRWIVSLMIPNLVADRNLKMFIRQQHFRVAEPIADNIYEGISSSRKTVFFITRMALTRQWREFEMEQARLMSVERRRSTTILVFFEPIPVEEMPLCLRHLWSESLKLNWNSDAGNLRPNEREMFWEKLYRAIVE